MIICFVNAYVLLLLLLIYEKNDEMIKINNDNIKLANFLIAMIIIDL